MLTLVELCNSIMIEVHSLVPRHDVGDLEIDQGCQL